MIYPNPDAEGTSARATLQHRFTCGVTGVFDCPMMWAGSCRDAPPGRLYGIGQDVPVAGRGASTMPRGIPVTCRGVCTSSARLCLHHRPGRVHIIGQGASARGDTG